MDILDRMQMEAKPRPYDPAPGTLVRPSTVAHPAAATRPIPVLLASALAAACGGSGEEDVSGTQNVLLFTIDTLRADQLGAYGNAEDASPAADALAREGLMFERAYSQATLTNPSLTSMLTGLLPIQTGVHDQTSGFAKGIYPVPVVLQAEGVATGAFIANMCKLQDTPGTVFHDGWDERFCGMLDDPENYSDQYLWDQAVVDAALEWIDAQEGPWFCWVHLMDPHAEHRPPPHLWDWEADEPREKFEQYAYYNQYEELREIPPDDVKDRLWALYSAQVKGSDEQLARMVDGLRTRGAWDDTAVIYSSDHGEELFETWHRYDHGLSMTEGVFHIPLIVRAPGVAPRRTEGIVENLQIGPTILDLFELDEPYELAGASLLDEEPSRGFALSYVGDVTTSIRGGSYRFWLRHSPEPFERDHTPWRHEAPWFQNRRSLASYSDATGALPAWLDVDEPAVRGTVSKLERAIETRHESAKRRAGRRVATPELIEALRRSGYIDPTELGTDEQ